MTVRMWIINSILFSSGWTALAVVLVLLWVAEHRRWTVGETREFDLFYFGLRVYQETGILAQLWFGVNLDFDLRFWWCSAFIYELVAGRLREKRLVYVILRLAILLTTAHLNRLPIGLYLLWLQNLLEHGLNLNHAIPGHQRSFVALPFLLLGFGLVWGSNWLLSP